MQKRHFAIPGNTAGHGTRKTKFIPERKSPPRRAKIRPPKSPRRSGARRRNVRSASVLHLNITEWNIMQAETEAHIAEIKEGYSHAFSTTTCGKASSLIASCHGKLP